MECYLSYEFHGSVMEIITDGTPHRTSPGCVYIELHTHDERIKIEEYRADGKKLTETWMLRRFMKDPIRIKDD